MTNAPIILTQACDMYTNDPKYLFKYCKDFLGQ